MTATNGAGRQILQSTQLRSHEHFWRAPAAEGWVVVLSGEMHRS